MKRSFITGFICGGIICAAVTGFAVEYAVTANPFPVTVNGTEKAIEGYNINDNTYFKLRDVADAVGSFEVGFADNIITIDTAGAAPEQTAAPTLSAAPVDLSAAIVKGDDGKDYTTDGLGVAHMPEGDFVANWDIERMMKSMGIMEYEFAGRFFYKKGSDENILDDIPVHPDNSLLIPLDYYISTIKPIIVSLEAE